MEEKRDIKNLKEVLDLCFAIALPILRESKKDGFQYTDLFAFLSSPEFQASVMPALEGVTEIPVELKDFTTEEGFELALHIILKLKEFTK